MSKVQYPKKFTLSPDGRSLLVICDSFDEFMASIILGLIECADNEGAEINPLVDCAPITLEQKRAIASITVYHTDRWQKSFGPNERQF